MAIQQGLIKETKTSVRSLNIAPDILLFDDVENNGTYAFMEGLKSKPSIQAEFKDVIDEYLTRSALATAIATADATTIFLDAVDILIPGTVLLNTRTNEQSLVESTEIGSLAANVIRSVGTINGSSTGVAAAAVAVGDKFQIINNAVDGNESTSQISLSTTTSIITNQCGTFRRDIKMGREQIKEAHVTGVDWPYQIKKAGREINKDINRALLYGQRGTVTTASGKIIRLTNGITSVISTNVLDSGGNTLYEYVLDRFLAEKALRHGSKTKWAVCNLEFLLAMQQMGKSLIATQRNMPTSTGIGIGMTVYSYSAIGGTINFIEDRTISDISEGYGMCVIMDKEMMTMRHFSGNGITDTMHLQNDSLDSDNTAKGSYFYADMGVGYGDERHHAIIKNVKGGMAGKCPF